MNKPLPKRTAERGDVSLFIAILVITIVTSSTIVLASLLARQTHLNQDIVASERALSAANSGMEQAFYARLKSGHDALGPTAIHDSVTYSDGSTATYTADGYARPGTSGDELCAHSLGEYGGNQRRLESVTSACAVP